MYTSNKSNRTDHTSELQKKLSDMNAERELSLSRRIAEALQLKEAQAGQSEAEAAKRAALNQLVVLQQVASLLLRKFIVMFYEFPLLGTCGAMWSSEQQAKDTPTHGSEARLARPDKAVKTTARATGTDNF